MKPYAQCTDIDWLKSQIDYWNMRPVFDQWANPEEIKYNVACIRERLEELEG